MRLRTLSALAVLALLTPVIAEASTTAASQFVSATNSARTHHGLRHYGVPADLNSLARRWAQHMARQRRLSHNPNITSQVCCWSDLGENVGVGSSVGQIQRAFMNSPEHRSNILSRSYTQVGIGTARSSDGRLYVDEIFRRPESAHSSAAVAAPVTPTPPVRITSVRASRSVRRVPVHPHAVRHVAAPAAPHDVFAARLAAVRRQQHAPAPDPVAGAVAYVTVMRELTGSPS